MWSVIGSVTSSYLGESRAACRADLAIRYFTSPWSRVTTSPGLMSETMQAAPSRGSTKRGRRSAGTCGRRAGRTGSGSSGQPRGVTAIVHARARPPAAGDPVVHPVRAHHPAGGRPGAADLGEAVGAPPAEWHLTDVVAEVVDGVRRVGVRLGASILDAVRAERRYDVLSRCLAPSCPPTLELTGRDERAHASS